ncbi:hypothetical protein [Metamycoplasma hominis]|uniref:hypothetical protein n=1 Tax=Metamycoplasma hominis TaxID=2098 RepID=UPI001594BC0C|nr:hypothetical protein [Metamycoplasma hominis]QKX37640.1 hypothetical protein HU155_00790 [Metamycoplasma hominis]
MNKNIINLDVVDRQLTTSDGEKFYVIFDIEENGEHYLVLTDYDAIIFAKEQDQNLIEVTDEGEIDILVDLTMEFAENNFVLDKDGKSDLMKKLIGNDQGENEA